MANIAVVDREDDSEEEIKLEETEVVQESQGEEKNNEEAKVEE